MAKHSAPNFALVLLMTLIVTSGIVFLSFKFGKKSVEVIQETKKLETKVGQLDLPFDLENESQVRLYHPLWTPAILLFGKSDIGQFGQFPRAVAISVPYWLLVSGLISYFTLKKLSR